jgi:hypothetical protein
MGRIARNIILKNNSEHGKDVEQLFTQSGGHPWDHKDPDQGKSYLAKATFEFLCKFD